MELFRKQAIEHQGNRLYGDVALTTPVSTWALTGLIGTIIAGIGIALFLGSYARKETVSGWLIPDKGLVKIVSPQLGTIATVHVEEGQAVDAGAHLITLDLDTVFAGGDGVIETALSELEAQIAEREKLIALTVRRFEQDVKTLQGQIASAQTELARLQEQSQVLNERIMAANGVLERYSLSADENAASILEVERQRESVLALEQSATQVSQQIDTKRGEITTLQNRLEGQPVQRETALAELRQTVSSLRAQRAQLSRQGSMVMTAPVSGRVAAVPVTNGQSIRPQELAIALLPEGGLLEAELFVPTRAAGFIREGQNVQVQFEAFPFQKFGGAQGTVATASKTIFEPTELPVTLGLAEPVYRVVVDLEDQQVDAYGEKFPLQAGMTLKADIVQEKRKLWEVLLEPLLSRI